MKQLIVKMKTIINDELLAYEKKSKITNNRIKQSLYKKNVNFLNERSIAFQITKALESHLNLLNLIIYSEFHLKSQVTLTQKAKKDISLEIPEYKKESNKYDYYPDTYLSFKNNKGIITDIFIEYKVDSAFSFRKLAGDFLKFKYYTWKGKGNNNFIYILFGKKNTAGIEIPCMYQVHDNNNIQEINKYLIEKDLNKKANIFYYINDKGNSVEIKENTLINANKLLDEIIKLEEENLYNEIHDYSQKDYFSNINQFIFGEKVLLSKIIQNNFYQIKQLYKEIIERKNINLLLPKKTYLSIKDFVKNDISNISLTVKEIANHFNKQIIRKSTSSKKGINQAEFTIRLKRSLWMLIILDKFSKDNDFKTRILNENSFSQREWNEIELLKERLDEIYKSKENFNILSLGLIYYIVNLYEEVGALEGNEYVLSKEFKAFRTNKKIEKYIRNICEELNIKNESEDISDKEIGLNIINALL
ncbi:hypothetical protein [Spiroplasma culicicola]|uniref:Uncharacterized protein n=1 Tax=Spiroplasma culicicola AES-1 TaxID=1276246 RepID=W6A725_9MOLU|nr:hypothetical protein [Spiroplasma culicicola]AHI52766.1 hypothetical protein SCULI_v1c04250 [Spiroplasma culicicola AES-1]